MTVTEALEGTGRTSDRSPTPTPKRGAVGTGEELVLANPIVDDVIS